METKARVTFQQSLGSQMATSPPTEQQVPAAPPRGDSWFTKFLLAVGFSFVSGWIDAVSLIRFRAFGTMMVGNVLYWGIHLVYGQIAHPDVVGHALVVHSETVRSSIVSTQFYGIVVLCYLAGIMLHTALNKYTRLTARTYAPIIVACTVLFEVMVKAHVGHMPHEAYYLCFLAPVFGFMNSLIFVGRVGRLPWATTADMQTLGSTLVLMLASVGRQWHLGVRGVRGTLASMVRAAPSEEMRKFAISFGMLAFMIFGVVAGVLLDAYSPDNFDFEFTVVSPLLALLLLLNEPSFNFCRGERCLRKAPSQSESSASSTGSESESSS